MSAAVVRDVAVAIVLAVVIAAVEYFFRHYVLFWMPVIGSLQVNDMIALALAYSALTVAVGSMMHVRWREELAGVGRALVAFAKEWTYIRWVLAIIVALVVLPPLDRWLWAGAKVPMYVSAYRNADAWLLAFAPALAVVSSLAVNGIVVPVAEEYLWRGQVQPRFERALPAAAAIAITSILFSLKHVLVDASFARFLTLVAFGAVCGIVARRHAWKGSAAVHAFVNTVTTAVGLVARA